MSFTAEEYRTAAKVMKANTDTDWPKFFEKQAEKVEAREAYARALAGCQVPNDSNLLNGARILDRLIRDGWTPPEGLF